MCTLVALLACSCSAGLQALRCMGGGRPGGGSQRFAGQPLWSKHGARRLCLAAGQPVVRPCSSRSVVALQLCDQNMRPLTGALESCAHCPQAAQEAVRRPHLHIQHQQVRGAHNCWELWQELFVGRSGSRWLFKSSCWAAAGWEGQPHPVAPPSSAAAWALCPAWI